MCIYEDDIRKNIREQRDSKGMSLAGLGALVGVTGQAIYQYESGRRSLKIAMIEKIAAALDVTLGTLLDSRLPSSSKPGIVKPFPLPQKWSGDKKLKEQRSTVRKKDVDNEMEKIIQETDVRKFLCGFFIHVKNLDETNRLRLMRNLQEIVEAL